MKQTMNFHVGFQPVEWMLKPLPPYLHQPGMQCDINLIKPAHIFNFILVITHPLYFEKIVWTYKRQWSSSLVHPFF